MTIFPPAASRRGVVCLIACLLTPVLLSCTSRYRVDLFLTVDEQRNHVKIEHQQYVGHAELNVPDSDRKIITGEDACIVVETGARGKVAETTSNLLGYDEYLRSRIYVQVAHPAVPGPVSLKRKSFVQVMGRFELATEAKLFLFEEGMVTVDSVTSKHMFVTFDAEYKNRLNQSLVVDGEVRINLR